MYWKDGYSILLLVIAIKFHWFYLNLFNEQIILSLSYRCAVTMVYSRSVHCSDTLWNVCNCSIESLVGHQFSLALHFNMWQFRFPNGTLCLECDWICKMICSLLQRCTHRFATRFSVFSANSRVIAFSMHQEISSIGIGASMLGVSLDVWKITWPFHI